MPNEINRTKAELIEQLKLNTKDMEEVHHELEQMLDQELAKPAEEIDANLVEELLDLLNAPTTSDDDKDATWDAIEQNMVISRKPKLKSILMRCAAVAATVLVLFFVTIKSAEAFQWTTLLKLFEPLAETFGIYSTSNPDYNQSEAPSAYSEAKTDFAQVTYNSLEDMPQTLHGVRVVPTWIMDGYTFVQGSVYEDPAVTTTTIAYMREDDIVILNVLIFSHEEPVSSYQFEQSFLEIGHEQIAGEQVTLYTNNQSSLDSFSWIHGNTHYMLTGNVSIDDLTKIIESLLS